MNKDEQARARLVEIAEKDAALWLRDLSTYEREFERREARRRAGFRDPSKGSWCAAGLTAAMEDAGLVVPAPGTPARRGAVALLDWEIAHGGAGGNHHVPGVNGPELLSWTQPGDVIAWLQYPLGKDPAGWRRGHVALIVAVDDESITTVGWNEGAAPGRVMKRRLWLDPSMFCLTCRGAALVPRVARGKTRDRVPCRACRGTGSVRPIDTVLHRKPNGRLYGIARPVAR